MEIAIKRTRKNKEEPIKIRKLICRGKKAKLKEINIKLHNAEKWGKKDFEDRIMEIT